MIQYAPKQKSRFCFGEEKQDEFTGNIILRCRSRLDCRQGDAFFAWFNYEYYPWTDRKFYRKLDSGARRH